MTGAPATVRAGGGGVVSLDYGLASTMLALGEAPRAVVSLRNWGEWVVVPNAHESEWPRLAEQALSQRTAT